MNALARPLGLAAVLSSVVLLTGCSSSSSTPSVQQPSPSVTPSACPGLAQPSGIRNWPKPVPADLPRPPGSNHASVALANSTLTVVQFTSEISLREAVLFVLNDYPKAGFVLGRGDAEIALDYYWWTQAASEEQQRALLDHELHHIAVVMMKHSDTAQREEDGRPKLRLRKHDFEWGWFNVIAHRHGEHSQERIQAKEIVERAGQFYFAEFLK